MKLLSKAKTHIQDWASTYLLKKIYASQRVFLDSIGLQHRDVDLEISLEAAHLMKYCPELDCMIPRIIDMRYEQKNGNESASVWTAEDERIWQQIIKA